MYQAFQLITSLLILCITYYTYAFILKMKYNWRIYFKYGKIQFMKEIHLLNITHTCRKYLWLFEFYR